MTRSLPLLSIFLLANIVTAQPRPVPLVEKINVSVINVDATVVDQSGVPVSNLTANDFEVFEDGKPQKITNFYAVDHATVRPELTSQPAAPQTRFRRKAVLIVDNHFVDKRRRDAALRQLRQFIDSDYAGQYDWSVAIIAGGVHVVQPFTSDKAVIDATLDRVIRGGTIAQVAAITGNGQIADPSQRASMVASGAEDRAAAMTRFDKDARFATTLDAMRASARAVIDACRAYSSIDGKKLIVLVTGAMEIDNRQPESNIRVMDRAADNVKDAMDIREAMIREANAANFNIYVVNAEGVTSPVQGFDVSERLPGEGVRGDVRSNDTFAVGLASQTGGMYLTSNVLQESIKTIDNVSATFYSIGYSPSHFEDGKYHRIKVRVKNNPAYQVLSRSGYLDASTDTRLEESLKVAASTAVPEGDLPVRIEVGNKASNGRAFTVPVRAALPLGRLTVVKQGGHNAGRVHVYLSIFDQDGKNIGFQHAVQDFALTDAQLKEALAPPETNFRYTMKVQLKPGLYRVVMALRDDVSDEVGKASATVDTRS